MTTTTTAAKGTTVTAEVTADCLRRHDRIVLKSGEVTGLESVRKSGEVVIVTLFRGDDDTYAVDTAYLVKVVTEEDCWTCGGRGIWYGRGYVENNVFKGQTGPCFRCRGKGRQKKQGPV